MSIKTFVEQLKAGNISEAVETFKAELDERITSLTKVKEMEIATSYGLQEKKECEEDESETTETSDESKDDKEGSDNTDDSNDEDEQDDEDDKSKK